MKSSITSLAGKDLALDSLPDRFVSRAPAASLTAAGFTVLDQLSTRSFSVRADGNSLDAAMVRARSLGEPAYPYYTVRDTGNDFLVTDRVFVRFKAGVSEDEQQALATEYGARILENFNFGADVVLQIGSTTDPADVVHRLNRDTRVEIAEPDLNHRVRPFEFRVPDDILYPMQWHLHDHVVDESFRPAVSTHCEEAWRLLNGFGSSEVIVGLTDGGVDLSNPDFRSSANRFAGWGYFRGNFIRTNLNARATVTEMAETPEHGTAMAGLIGAARNGEFAVGVAPGCRLLPVRFENNGRHLFVSTSRARTAFRFLAHRTDVISSSWGVGEDCLWGRMFTEEIEHLAGTSGRRGKGVVFVWAAGNSNCPISRDFISDCDVPIDNGRPNGFFEGPRTARRFRNDLVNVPGVIHVSAVSSTGRRSHYSNYGSGLRLCAPSDNEHLYGCPAIVGDSLPIQSSPSAATLQRPPGGTSAATAIVAGVAALVISANPSLTARRVISILQQTANKDLDTTPYAKTGEACGFGGDFDVSPVAPWDAGEFRDFGDDDGTWSPWFGFGSVNAAKAVALAQNLPEETKESEPVTNARQLSPRCSPTQ
jgi:subtilisin family serine protease